MADFGVNDVTMRDGQLSLWATRMTTAMILPAAAHIERVGYRSAEVIGGGFFKKVVRDLHDDPWERVRRIKAVMPTTPLRAIQSRYAAAFQYTSQEIHQLWGVCLLRSGVEEVRLSDPSNTPSYWEANVETATAVGLRVILNLVYSVSPKHTDEYYQAKAKAAAQLPILAVCLKDPGGLMTPDRLQTLVPVIRQQIGNLRLEFHGHCNNSLGPLNAMEAVRLGVDSVHTAIPPLANGASLPSVFNLAGNAAALGLDPDLDLDAARRAGDHLELVAAANDFPRGTPAEYDQFYYGHQVPGGMISNLRSQLAAAGMGDRLHEVLDETVQVRADMGYPIMVTPYSQFVGIQAALNVMTGERYSQVTDELIQYALGQWGAEERDSIDPNIRNLILDRRRARELEGEPMPELSLADARRQLGSRFTTDEDLLMRLFAGSDAVDAMYLDPAPREFAPRGSPWVRLLEQMAGDDRYSEILVEKGTAKLHAVRRR